MPKYTMAERNAEALHELKQEVAKLTVAMSELLSLFTKSTTEGQSTTESHWFFLDPDKDDEHE